LSTAAERPRAVGVRGGTWRALVDGTGTVIPQDGSAPLAWHVAGDDRWYSPSDEPTVRHKWYSGYPVAETRMRVGQGDIVQRVWCVADLGGITVVEFENETPAPVAVAVTRGDVLSTRPLGDNPPMGIDLPAGSHVLPLGHRATVRIGLSHADPGPGRLPDDVPGHQQVVRGWETACDIASRVTLADHTVVASMNAARSRLLLGDTGDREPDGAAVIELVRLGETHRDSILEVVDAVQARLRTEKRSRTLAWDTPHLLATAARACVLLDDDTAAGDIGAAWLRLADRPVQEPPAVMPGGVASVAWTESVLVRPSPSGGLCEVFPFGIPETWWGTSVDCRGLIGDPHRSLSFSVRWHGARPALLWEVAGPAGLVLTGGSADGEWHTADSSGETLLAAPVRSGA
jgi:hypothetical protein